MEMTRIAIADATALDRIPESCGEVTVSCSDLAGIVQAVIDTSGRLRSEHIALQGTVMELESDHLQVTRASDEARAISGQARARSSSKARS